MRVSFPHDDLIRVSAVDGREWESGGRAAKGQPLFKEDIKNELIRKGYLAEKTSANYIIPPGQMATAISHMEVWQKILDENIHCAVVLEDDVKPCGDAIGKSITECFDMPKNADVLLLTGPDKLFDIEGVKVPFTSLDIDGRVINAFGGCGYAITNTGARRALQAVRPLHYHFCRQWWITACHGTGMFASGVCTQEDSGLLYGVPAALVEHSDHAEKSEVTADGSKPWRVYRS